jgi:hypothetical protein
MTSELIDGNAELSAHDETAFAWPRGSNDDTSGFAASSTSRPAAMARQLVAMARAADLNDADPVERLRAWRRAGDAFLALDAAADALCLQGAAEAYSIAEVLLSQVEIDVLERVQLHHAHGRTLLRLSEDCDVELAAAAAMRLAIALSLARQHIPEHVAGIKLELCRAEHVIAIRQGAAAVHPMLDENYA